MTNKSLKKREKEQTRVKGIGFIFTALIRNKIVFLACVFACLISAEAPA